MLLPCAPYIFNILPIVYHVLLLILQPSGLNAEDSEECLSADHKPGDYRGKVNVAYDGTPCEKWSNHPQFFRRKWTMDEAIQHKNYCRNPDGDINGPWCVVPNNSFRYCNIPTCARDVQCYEGKGEDYVGEQRRTIRGVPCQHWTHSNAVKMHKSSYRFRLYENATNNMTLHFLDPRLMQFRSCRNPGGTRSRPWCYSTLLSDNQMDNMYCDIPNCADPSVLGYPLSWNDTVCPPGFHRQTQISMENTDTRVELDYCVAPERLLHPVQRQEQYSRFVNFCLYLISSTTTCPAGFRSVDKFQLVLDPIKHLSGPAAWRSKAESLIQSIICCSKPDYFRSPPTIRPYFTIEKVSRYKRFEGGFINMIPSRRRNNTWRHITMPLLVNMGFEDDTEEIVNDQPDLPDDGKVTANRKPVFASVRQCPPVENTSRVLMLAMTPRFRSGQGLGLLQALPPEVICEYYEVQQPNPSNTPQIADDRSLVLIVDEPTCPPDFTWLPMPFKLKLILGSSKGLCRPSESMRIRHIPNANNPGYCMLSVPENTEEVRESDTPNNERGRPTEFACPSGFRANELYFHEPQFRIRLCCAGSTNQTAIADPTIPIQAPFPTRIPFAVLQNGDRCPQFHSGSVQLLSVEYSRAIRHTYLNRMEMFGPDQIVKLAGIPSVVLCQYLSTDLKLGVKSLTFDCDGLGSRISMGPYGANCGFKVNDSVTFPPGRYCLLQFSSACPAGFTHRGASMSVRLRLRSVGNTCCREEETIGAIQFPIKIDAPFKLPAIRAPCQTIEGFNVDAELGHCLYYPRGDTPQALMVWPRVLGTSETPEEITAPAHCALSPRRRPKIHRSQIGRLSTLFFNLMQDHWLVSRRTRWNTNMTDNVDVCFNEVPWSLMPPASKSGKPYCTFVFGSCPKPQFETVGSSIYFNTVLCCTIATASGEAVEYSKRLRSLVTLGHPTTHDTQSLRGVLGTRVLDTNPDPSQNSCPEFEGVQLRRRVAEGVMLPTHLSDAGPTRLALLFNATHMSDSDFRTQTGIWMEDRLVHVIYCEYNSKKLDDYESAKTTWPSVDFAIPKALNDCPSGSTKAIIRHHQDQFGFHYSQPIHLDGLYLQGEKVTWLEYCVFKSDTTSSSTFNYGIRDELPAGHYCVLRVRGSCPAGFTKGVLNVMEGPQKVGEGPTDPQSVVRYAEAMDQLIVPDIERVRVQMKDSSMKMDRLDYYFCCRADSPSADIPIQGFPTETGPFFLYRFGDKCQRIEGMRVNEEYVCWDAPNQGQSGWWALDPNQTWTAYHVKGTTPARMPFHGQCDVEIRLCYYERELPEDEEDDTITIQNTGDWPIGSYALPNVHRDDESMACPPGFKQKYISLINRQAAFFDLQLLPSSFGSYFLDLIGHNFSALNVHYCERMPVERVPGDEDAPRTPPPTPLTDEEAARQWPKGDYCVFSTAPDNHCPPGLHRHSRSVAEMCCRNDKVKDPAPMNWPFVGDFFLFGGEKCLPISNTRVERYLVRLILRTDIKSDPQWDVLCHYIPESWFGSELAWPSGEYLLPIGRRGGLKTNIIRTVEYADSIRPSDVVGHPFTDSDSKGLQPNRYKCPDTFERVRFTFVSKTFEQRHLPDPRDNTTKMFKVSAVTSMEFCLHNETKQTENKTTEWPAGDYCVFTMNTECPMGMRARLETPLKIPRFVLKSIYVLDEYGKPIENRHWHEEALNHVVYFMHCCRDDKQLLLRLPPSPDGYYLGSSSGLCSHIPGTLLDRERVTSYLTAPPNIDQFFKVHDGGSVLYRELAPTMEGVQLLCYYHPSKGIDYSTWAVESFFSNLVNLTEKDVEEMAALCGCAKNAFCYPRKRAECICKPGYFGDGRHRCHPVTPLTDECADLCDRNAVCEEHLNASFRKMKQLLSHMCVCRSGYVGDGFTCQPSCAVKECPPFSRCVHNPIQSDTKCECIPGTIESDGQCHLDLYKSLEHEKDLPQFLLHHDHCLSTETQNALQLLNPARYFYVFIPKKVVQTCGEARMHIVVRKSQLSMAELAKATDQAPIQLRTENDTMIEVYLENTTWMIDGHRAQQAPIRFTNGEILLLSDDLNGKPFIQSNVAWIVTVTILSLLVLALIAFGIVYVIRHRYNLAARVSRLLPFRRQMRLRRTFWRQHGEDILVDDPDSED